MSTADLVLVDRRHWTLNIFPSGLSSRGYYPVRMAVPKSKLIHSRDKVVDEEFGLKLLQEKIKQRAQEIQEEIPGPALEEKPLQLIVKRRAVE